MQERRGDRGQDEKVRGVMEEHRPEEERREDQAVGESHDEEQDHEEVTEGDLETFGGGGGEEEELGVLCFICGSLASHPQLAACLCSTCRSCAAESGGREGRVTCSKCDVSTPISALLPDYVHDRSAPSPPPSAHPSPPRLASLQSLLHRSCSRNIILFLLGCPLRARTRGGGVESYGDSNPELQQVPLSTDSELLALLFQGEEESRSKIEESYVFLRRALDQARDSALQQLEERVKLKQAAKKKSLHQQESRQLCSMVSVSWPLAVRTRWTCCSRWSRRGFLTCSTLSKAVARITLRWNHLCSGKLETRMRQREQSRYQL